MIFCMKCGKQLPDEAIFCKYCGASTEMDGGGVQNHSTTQTVFKPQTKKDDDVEHFLRDSKPDPIEEILNRHKVIDSDQEDIYIDHEYHSGLARKNVGGTYNESLDIIEGGKWGFINLSGKEVIPVVFDEVSIFIDVADYEFSDFPYFFRFFRHTELPDKMVKEIRCGTEKILI